MTSFFRELKRRHVYRVAVAYAVVGWLVIQVAATIAPALHLPGAVTTAVVVLVLLGFPVALVLAWAFELTPGGFTRTAPSTNARTPDAARADSPSATDIPKKSIAVLPFESLSSDEENAFFADGVQNEILTTLAKVADLKVISRTSVMQYKSAEKRNLPEIAQALKVAHVLEGSVQRSANRVRVNAQLIDARTDAHLWAQTYDRELADVFAIQSEIAGTIANQLHAKISPREKAALNDAPTHDLAANALYVEAMHLRSASSSTNAKQSLLQAAQLLDAAVARDPNFVVAYCLLSTVHLELYFGGADHTVARRELAHTAIQNAARLAPDAGEVHLGMARYVYNVFRDYDRARAELDLARRTLPNSSEIYLLKGALDRRQARWAESVRNWERAVELDPRNVYVLENAAFTYKGLKRYAEARQLFARSMAVAPRNYNARTWHALMSVFERADNKPLRDEISAILKEDPNAAAKILEVMFLSALWDRDPQAAERAVAAIPPEGIATEANFTYPREWFVGVAARTFDDPETARSAFTAARVIAEKLVHEQPEYAPAWALLGDVDAALGRKEEAVREGRRACELLPISKDSWIGPEYVVNLAAIYAWAGETDLALEQLAMAVAAQGAFSPPYGVLKLDPRWDPLRGDPRFEKIVADLAPKE